MRGVGQGGEALNTEALPVCNQAYSVCLGTMAQVVESGGIVDGWWWSQCECEVCVCMKGRTRKGMKVLVVLVILVVLVAMVWV